VAPSATSRGCRSSKRSASSATICHAVRDLISHAAAVHYRRGRTKTKPTQHSVKELRSIGIQPDILLCRCDRPIPAEERRKLGLFCNVRPSAVIEARDVDNIYAVPEAYHEAGLDREVLAAFGIEPKAEPDLSVWRNINARIRNPEGEVTIAVVGKYTGMKDAYKSLIEALSHGGISNKVAVSSTGSIRALEMRTRCCPSSTSTVFWFPAASAAGGGGDWRRVRALSTGCVFQHLWHRDEEIGAARNRAGSKTPTPPSSARPQTRWSA
jgi:hypothetical protein